jgi:energy-coupling factor transporter ATP-binding protein EcfA2
VLGGGVVPGSLILVGGDPGIGKSTLMLQLSRALASRGKKVLYVAGEESAPQVRLRAARLGEIPESLYLLCETEVETVLEEVRLLSPDAVIVDSIQTATIASASGAPGAVTQVRESALAYLDLAKGAGVPGVPRRARHQGRRGRRPARARAHGRRRPVPRRRALSRRARAAGGEEPLRLDRRAGRLHDGRGRPARSRRRRRAPSWAR